MVLSRIVIGIVLTGALIAGGRSGYLSQALPQEKTAPALPFEVGRLQLWLQAVRAHDPGKMGPSVRELAEWPESNLKAVRTTLIELRDALAHDYLRHGPINSRYEIRMRTGGGRIPAAAVQELLGQTDDEARRGDINRLLVRAAVLHSDIAIAVSGGMLEVTASAPDVHSVRFVDGRQVGPDYSARQWQMAGALLDAITWKPPEDEAVHLWYLAAAEHMRTHHELGIGLSILRRAREMFPKDADILFYSGCVNENLASPRLQNAFAATPQAGRMVGASPGTTGTTFFVAPARTYLESSATFYRQALQIRPSWPEARVHLGRVYGLLGRHDDAATELRRALDETRDPTLIYCASVFLGNEELARKDVRAARICFERAQKYRPRAQAPHLALSLIARNAGDRGAAKAEVRKVLDLPADEATRYDPLWDYDGPKSSKSHVLFEKLRATVRAGASR